MVYKSRMLDSAVKELDTIVSYLISIKFDLAQAFLESFEKQLDAICEGLITHGLSRMPQLAQLGYRCALFDDYLFLYYFEDDAVIIAHICSQRQDYAALVVPAEK